jgi:cytochrome c-type biogenesis protein CcmI
MSVFVLGTLILVALAVLIVYLPLRKTANQTQTRRDINQQLVQDRLGEMDKERQEGLLTDEDNEMAQSELKLAFVDEQESLNDDIQPIKHAVSTRWVAVIFVLGMLFSGGVYVQVNELDNLNHWLKIGESSKTLQAKLASGTDLTREDLIDIALGVRTKLIQNPEDGIAWQWLGRIYTNLQRPDMAIDAMERSVILSPKDPIVLENFARTLLLQGSLESFERAKSVIFKLLDVEPNHRDGLAMLGLAAEQLGDTQLAVDAWKAVKEQLSGDDPFNQIVDRQLAKLTQVESKVIAENASDDNENIQVDLTITIAEDLLAKSGQLPYLFVFAQDGASGSRVPAAVVRLPVSGFPIKVSLNNSHAMVPGFNLSSLKEAKLVARLSMDENVTVQAGELEGELIVTLIKGETAQYDILINKEL